MKTIIKNIPILLYATALLSIAVLSAIVVHRSDVYVSAQKNDETPIKTDPSAWENTSKDEPIFPEKTDNTDNAPPEETVEKKYFGSIPRSAEADDKYVYTQTIYGNGKTLLYDVLQTSVGIFTVVQTDSTEGDVSGSAPCVGIVKSDSYGNILSAVSLDGKNAKDFVSAAPTALGIVLVTGGGKTDSYFLHIVSYDLAEEKVFKITSAKGGKVVPTQRSFLFFAYYDTETVLYSYSDEKISFQSVGSGEICELFEFSSYYIVYLSDKSGNKYNIEKIDKSSLRLLSERKVSDALVQSVFPVNENGKQYYILFEEKTDGISVVKSSSPLFADTLEEKRLGNFTAKNAFFDGENILLLCEGNIKGIVKVSPDLTARVVGDDEARYPENILDCIFSGKTLYCLGTDAEKNVVFGFSENNVVSTEYFNEKTDKAKLIGNLDGTFNLFLQANDDVKIICFSLA